MKSLHFVLGKIHKLLKWPIWAPFYTLFLCYLCVIPSVQLPNVTSDKTAHLSAFFLITFLWMILYPNYKTVIAMLLLGIVIEVVQYELPASFNRGFELADIWADYKGVIVGVIFYKFYEWLVIRNLK